MHTLATMATAGVAALSVGGLATAQSTYDNWAAVDRTGDWRLAVSGSINFTETDLEGGGSFDRDTYAIDATAGYFLNPANELGFDIGYFNVDGVVEDSEIFSFRPRYTFHFASEGPIDPYIGARGGISMLDIDTNAADDDDTGWTYGGFGGVNFSVDENVAIFAEVGYDWYEFDDFDQEELRIAVGIAMYF